MSNFCVLRFILSYILPVTVWFSLSPLLLRSDAPSCVPICICSRSTCTMSLTCDEVEDACIGRVRGRQVGHAQFSSTVCADHARGQWENTDTGIECKQHLVPNLQRCRHRESARVTLPSFKLSACSVSLMSSLACAITQFFWVGTSTFSTKRCDR